MLFYRLLNLRKSPVLKSMGIYTVSNFFSKAIAFLLIPLFTRPEYLTPDENGLLNLFSQSIIFVIPFISLGVLQSTSTDYFKLEKHEFRDLFTTGFVMSFTVSLISVAVFFLLRNQLNARFHFPLMFMWLIPLVTFFTFCYEMLLNMIRNNNNPMGYLKLNVTKIIIELGLSVTLIVWFNWRWQGRITGIVVSYIFVFIYATWFFTRQGYLSGKIRKKYLKEELIYAVPIILMQWGVFCTNSADNFIVTNYYHSDTHWVGIYGLVCNFGAVQFILCTAMMQYIMPRIYSILSGKTGEYRSIRKLFYFYISIMTAGCIGLLLFVPIIYKLFINKAYHSALHYYYFIVIGYYFWCVSYFFYSFLLYNKQKKRILLLSALNIVISLSLYYSFTQMGGVEWTAKGVFISFSLILCSTLIGCRKYLGLVFGNNSKQPTLS